MKRHRIWIIVTALMVVLASVAGLALANVGSGEAEVRISARRLDDGRTEFALQQRTAGQWGERILPRSRFFPATPRSDAWLNSSSLTVATEGPIVRETGTAEYDNGRITTSVETRVPYGAIERTLHSSVTVKADGRSALGLRFECGADGIRFVEVINLPRLSTEARHDELTVEFQFTPPPSDWTRRSGLETWAANPDWGSNQGYWITYSYSRAMIYSRLRDADSFEVEIDVGSSEPLRATFSLNGVFDTPIQPNIDRCGDYY